MIEEDYVSFETAKLLKEKGFNGPCFAYYSEFIANWKTLKLWKRYPKTYDTVRNDGYLLVSTLQTAMKWLREEKNIFVDVYYEEDVKGYMYSIIKLPKGTPLNVSDLADNSYEKACEEAIKYCLRNLI